MDEPILLFREYQSQAGKSLYKIGGASLGIRSRGEVSCSWTLLDHPIRDFILRASDPECSGDGRLDSATLWGYGLLVDDDCSVHPASTAARLPVVHSLGRSL